MYALLIPNGRRCCRKSVATRVYGSVQVDIAAPLSLLEGSAKGLGKNQGKLGETEAMLDRALGGLRSALGPAY